MQDNSPLLHVLYDVMLREQIAFVNVCFCQGTLVFCSFPQIWKMFFLHSYGIGPPTCYYLFATSMSLGVFLRTSLL